MKKIITLLLIVLLIMTMTACGAEKQTDITDDDTPSGASVPETDEPDTSDVPADPVPGSSEEHSETLVVVFSATGTTKGVAEKIAAITGADFYEIKAAVPYTSADLNYSDKSSRTSKEQNDKSIRPAIGSEPLDLNGYKTVFIGFPIWWGEEPRIMDNFAESYDFTGITVIPFCTSGSSGIGKSGSNMEELAGSGKWLAGKRFPASVTEEEIRSWIDGLQ